LEEGRCGGEEAFFQKSSSPPQKNRKENFFQRGDILAGYFSFYQRPSWAVTRVINKNASFTPFTTPQISNPQIHNPLSPFEKINQRVPQIQQQIRKPPPPQNVNFDKFIEKTLQNLKKMYGSLPYIPPPNPFAMTPMGRLNWAKNRKYDNSMLLF